MYDVVDYLLSHGQGVNDCNDEGYTALHYAARWGQEEVAKLLLRKGANRSATRTNNNMPIAEAVYEGHLQLVKLLLPRDPDRFRDMSLSKSQADAGYLGKALQRAAGAGQEEVVRLLLQFGADVSSGTGINALPVASRRGHIRIVRLLLDAGADMNVTTALYGSALQEACSEGRDNVVQALLQRGADINLHSPVLGTPLHAASRGGYPAIVRRLIAGGVEVNTLCFTPMTGHQISALHDAVHYGDVATVQVLLESGADINAGRGTCGTPLFSVINRLNPPEKQAEIFELLVECEADPSIPDINGTTPLHRAASQCSPVLLRLLQNESDLFSIRDLFGRIPLHYTVRALEANLDGARMDLKPTQDPLVLDGDGRTPLDWALSYPTTFSFNDVDKYLRSQDTKYTSTPDAVSHAIVHRSVSRLARALLESGSRSQSSG
jgi:ankyrin repeat protein